MNIIDDEIGGDFPQRCLLLDLLQSEHSRKAAVF